MANPNRRPVLPTLAAAAATSAAAPSAADRPAPVAEQAAETSPTIETAPINGDIVEGRVIVAFEDYEPNDVYAGSADDALVLEISGHIDCHPSAVAYAKSLADA